MIGRSRRRAVLRVLRRAEAVRPHDPAGAVPEMERALAGARQLVQDESTVEHRLLHATVASALGALYDTVDRHAEALAGVHEAAVVLERLDASDDPEVAALRTQALAQRGLVLAHLGRGATAVVVLQEAWRQAVREVTVGGDTGAELERARIQAQFADVQLTYGDPDLALVAAEHAWSVLLEHRSWSESHGLEARYRPSFLGRSPPRHWRWR